jgi:fatty acid desaturase
MAVQDKYEATKDDQDSSEPSRRQRRLAHRADRQAGGLGWLVGLILVVIGLLYLLSELGIVSEVTNWWALFLLLPAAGFLSGAVGAYRRNGGRWTPEAVLPLLGSLLLAALAAAFLFGINFSWLWPLLLIAAGLLLLIGSITGRSS